MTQKKRIAWKKYTFFIPALDKVPQEEYSLDDITRLYSIPKRKLAYLIRVGALEASFSCGEINITHDQLKNMLINPKGFT